MTNEVDFGHLWTLFKDAHSRSLDNILSHPLKAEDIEDLCEALGFSDYAFELKDDDGNWKTNNYKAISWLCTKIENSQTCLVIDVYGEEE